MWGLTQGRAGHVQGHCSDTTRSAPLPGLTQVKV